MPVPISSFTVDGRAVYSIALKDRTQRPHRNKTWLYKNQLEAAVYGPRETSNGALNKLLGRLSMNNSALLLNASAVEEGIVTEAEFTQIITHFQTNVLLSDAKGKAKNVSLVPTSVASAASQAYGRTPRTVELLRGLSALPRTWRLEEERDALAAQGEEDLALEDEIENEEIDETLDMDLAMEILVTSGAVYVEEAAQTQLMTNYQLSPVPAALEAQLQGLASFRSAPFNRHRSSGGSVTITTSDHDRQNALRFLAFCVQQKQQPADLKVLAAPNVGELTEAYLTALKEKGLMASSLANYTNSIISVASYAMTLVDHSDTPIEELINLRRQCESLAKSERLYQHRDKNWIDWVDAQKARVKAMAAIDAAPSSQKLATIKHALILAFHTLQCPDRVGVVRRLRFGVTLYKKEGETAWTVDLTKMKHKTSRFYGPTIHSLPSQLCPIVDKYHAALTFEFTGETPYLFQIGTDYSRGVSSSQWTQMVKAVFLKYSGVSPPPKLLRQSFITFMRSDPSVDKELLDSAAHAMKHLVTTGASDNYDKAAHDRLLSKANLYCAKIAAQYEPSLASTAAASAAAVDQTFTANLDDTQPVGDMAVYSLSIPMDDKTVGEKWGFPKQPPLQTAIAFVIPEAAVTAVELKIKLPKATSPPPSFGLKGLTLMTPAPRPVTAAAATVEQAVEEEAEAMEEEPPRQPVPSKTLPPRLRTEVDAALVALSHILASARGNGDCYPLAAMAGFEITASEAANPSEATTELVRTTRVAATNTVCGTAPIGGIEAKTLRREEPSIKVTPVAAMRQMTKWKSSFHWATSQGNLAAFFQFAIALQLDRPVAVIQIKSDQHYYDPARIYGMKDASGQLRKEPAARGKAESIPSYFLVPIADLLETLRTAPRSMSVIRYNGKDHFNPWLPPASAPPPPPPPPTILPTKKQKTDGKKKAVTAVSAAPSKEASIEEALSGIFSGFTCIKSPTVWLATALTDDTSRLIGSHVIFNWEQWGWAAGKISAVSTKTDSNVAVTYQYKGNWVEHQSLLITAYGDDDGHGSWMLLEATRPASPILEYKGGSYLVQRSTGNVWLRASDLLHHPDKDLATARANAAAAKRRQSQAAAELEIDAQDLAVGDTVFAKGLAPTGILEFFTAQVLAIRERFPPVQILYSATLSGATGSLLLPVPAVAFVPVTHIQREAPQVAASGKRARSKESYTE